jgi:hypothetical protein
MVEYNASAEQLSRNTWREAIHGVVQGPAAGSLMLLKGSCGMICNTTLFSSREYWLFS